MYHPSSVSALRLLLCCVPSSHEMGAFEDTIGAVFIACTITAVCVSAPLLIISLTPSEQAVWGDVDARHNVLSTFPERQHICLNTWQVVKFYMTPYFNCATIPGCRNAVGISIRTRCGSICSWYTTGLLTPFTTIFCSHFIYWSVCYSLSILYIYKCFIILRYMVTNFTNVTALSQIPWCA